MATSQFTVYSSYDVSAPSLTGLSGSLLDVLDGCLVNGYGSKVAAGWTKPLANSASMGCYKQPSGSLCTLFINDAAPSGSTTSGTRQAFATGYTSLTGYTGSLSGIGFGQFPATGQPFPTVSSGGTPSGSLWWRKSVNADSTTRQWVLYADAWTFYLFVITGDTAGVYCAYWFGDIFSLSPTDTSKCIIRGREADSTTLSAQSDTGDLLHLPNVNSSNDYSGFISNNFSGRGSSTPVIQVGDLGKGSPATRAVIGGSTAICGPMSGVMTVSNPIDNSLYMTPVWVGEQGVSALRGRYRGMYHLCHPITNFADGQIFSGANEYAGKQFQVVKTGPTSGMWVLEISNTVETN